jgi:hypothetical protein
MTRLPTSGLSSLELAKFILSRLVRDQDSIDVMAKELDGNERLVSEIVYFFIILVGLGEILMGLIQLQQNAKMYSNG